MDERKRKFSLCNHLIIVFHLSTYSLLLYEAIPTRKISFILFFTLLTLLNALALHKAALQPPGMLKRRSIGEFPIDSLHFVDGTLIKINILEDTREISFPDGKRYVQKFCTTCNTFRPVDASHCGICDGCVLERDHHCQILDTCIGRNNLRSFCAFQLTDGAICISLGLFLIFSSPTRLFCGIEIGILYVILGVSSTLFFVLYIFLGIAGVTSRTFLKQRIVRRFNFRNILSFLRFKSEIGVF